MIFKSQFSIGLIKQGPFLYYLLLLNINFTLRSLTNGPFYQSNNGMVPVFSVPRNLIAENPFTSLLLCSCLPSTVIDTDRSALSWCQLLTIEVISLLSSYGWVRYLCHIPQVGNPCPENDNSIFTGVKVIFIQLMGSENQTWLAG